MSILWCGGEDIDFPNGVPLNVAGSGRSGYSRCFLSTGVGGAAAKSTLFPGGAVTSCWVSFRHNVTIGNTTLILGVGKSGTNSGIFYGNTGSNCSIVQVSKFDGTTVTSLAQSSGSVLSTGSSTKIDLQIVNYGASSTINLYVSGSLVASYTGDSSITGVSGFDSVFLRGDTNYPQTVAEIIVADEPTLAFQGLVTLSPSGNGTTQNWSNPAYTNINPTTINDTNYAYATATGQDEQVTLPALPSGTYSIPLVKVVARAMATSGAASTNLSLGFRNASGTVAVNPQHAEGTVFATYEDYFTNDPTTSSAWSTLTSYQLDLRSA